MVFGLDDFERRRVNRRVLSSTAVFQREAEEPSLDSIPQGRMDAALGGYAGEDEVSDAPFSQNPIQARVEKRAEAGLVDHGLSGRGLETAGKVMTKEPPDEKRAARSRRTDVIQRFLVSTDIGAVRRVPLPRVHDKQTGPAGGGQYAQLKRWTLIPTSSTLGESVDEALGPTSQFRQRAASLPRDTTITVWTYQDSFEDFRRIKEELFAYGFETAGRPLPNGVPIGGSPDGTRSAAQ